MMPNLDIYKEYLLLSFLNVLNNQKETQIKKINESAAKVKKNSHVTNLNCLDIEKQML